MPPDKTLQLAPVADFTPFLSDGELVALDVGPDDRLYGVIALKALDYWKPGKGATFAKTTPSTPQTYRVLAFDGGDVTLDVRIADERFNIHEVQPLPNEELLLVCCRSRYRGPNDFDKNGRVYSSDGEFVREILLGDGIARIQTTSAGAIWTSYFDEGIFGNYGWKDPIGSLGLVASDPRGNKLYEFQPADGLDFICDCYAMNVKSDSSTWLYYYNKFPLVHLRNQEIEAHWAKPLAWSKALAISQGLALFAGAFRKPYDYHLFELRPDGKTHEVANFSLTDEHGDRLMAERSFGRSEALYIRGGNRVYRCDVQTTAGAQM